MCANQRYCPTKQEFTYLCYQLTLEQTCSRKEIIKYILNIKAYDKWMHALKNPHSKLQVDDICRYTSTV